MKKILSLIALCILVGCNSNKVTMKFSCSPNVVKENEWVYIYKLEGNNYHIADSCQVQNHKFKFKFDIPYEYKYTLLLPSSRCRKNEMILRPGENYNIFLADTMSPTVGTYMLLEALPQSPAGRAYYHREQSINNASIPIRAVNAKIDSLINAGFDDFKLLEDSLQILMHYKYIDLQLQLLNDSIIQTSPYASYSLLLGSGRNLPQYDSILQCVRSRFPDYPPLENIKNPAPQSPEGWRDEARIYEILGLPAPKPWVTPAVDTTPEPKSVTRYKIGDNINDWKILTADNRIVEPLKNITTDYVLIDFWASWCTPCITAIENNIRPFAKNNSDYLTVCAISIDKDSTAWKNAINKLQTDELFHHYQLQQPSTEYKHTLAEFGIRAIPFAILLDKDRNILSYNPSNKDLMNFINYK